MPQTPPQTESLTFHWARPGRKTHGLAFWIFVVLLGFAGFFYLFQVVYPQAQRFTPVPHHIVALNPADPAVRELMNKVQDIDFLILPPTTDGNGSVSLDDHSPLFHPTFEGHKLQLQDLPHTTFSVQPARLLQMDAPVLPPLDLNGLKPPATEANKPAPRALTLAMKLNGALASRRVIHAADLSKVPLSDPSTCRFQLGVKADGVVEVALPLASSETQETVQKLGGALREIRFAPVDAKAPAPMWGTVTFEWSKGTP